MSNSNTDNKPQESVVFDGERVSNYVGAPGPAYVGPEDALDTREKRLDYSGLIGPENYHPHEATRQPDGSVTLEPQRPRAEKKADK